MTQLRMLILVVFLLSCGMLVLLIYVISTSQKESVVHTSLSTTPTTEKIEESAPFCIGVIRNLPEFECSPFFKKYNIKRDKGWKDKSGELIEPYIIPSMMSTNLIVSSLNKEVTNIELTFKKKSQLTDYESNLVIDLLESIDSKTEVGSKLKETIKKVPDTSKLEKRDINLLHFAQFEINIRQLKDNQKVIIRRIRS